MDRDLERIKYEEQLQDLRYSSLWKDAKETFNSCGLPEGVENLFGRQESSSPHRCTAY